jgi:S-DNA-T family DNA segregation ATPase FtsK/SpoIIIE
VLFRFRTPTTACDLEVTTNHAEATVGDLAAALDDEPSGPAALWIDGRRAAATTPLAAARITNGSTVSRTPLPPDRPVAPSPSWAAGPHEAPTEPRHRTGRATPTGPPPPVALPDPAPTAPTVTPIGVVAVVASVLGAAVMVAVLGSWTYAAFAVVGPVMMVANSLDGRLRARRSRRRYARHVRREVVRLHRDLEGAAVVERARRAARYPGGDQARSTVDAHPACCWERRAHHDDAWQVRVGHGTARWAPALAGTLADAAPEVTEAVAAHRSLTATALGLDLQAAGAVAITGPAEPGRALARSMLVQLVAEHGPADVEIAALVEPESAGHWDWLAWLPHVVDRDGRRALATSGSVADEVATRLLDDLPTGASLAEGATAGTPALRVVLVDDPGSLSARRSASRVLLRRAADPRTALTCLVRLGPHDPVPAACTTVLRLDADGGLHAPPAVALGRATADRLGLAEAAAAARALSRFDDPEADPDGVTARSLPAEVPLTTLVEIDARDPAAVAERWQANGPDPAPVAVLGAGSEGPVEIDLAADGPHLLLAGTTGAGKSEALRSLVLALAATQSPDHLVFVLVDFKGGSAFDACARLPHTVGLVTDLDDHLAGRALRCLEAELRHRETLLRTHGAIDLAAYRAAADHDAPALPRLVVVVDEFATLAGTLPDFLPALVDVAQRGRSLGVHLILATQRPAGAVSPAIQANVGARIALRVQSEADSVDVIGTPAAAALPRHLPGRALVRFGPGDLVAVQVASSTGPARRTRPRVTVRPLGIPRPEAARDPGDPSRGPRSHPTDLDEVVLATGKAWSRLDRPAPRRPWPDPLPEHLDWPPPRSAESAPPGDPERLVLGLADEPDRQRTAAFCWEVDRGPLLGVGLPGSGPRLLAATVALAAAECWPASAGQIHVVDGAGDGLASLAGLPHVGAVVAAGELERQRRLVEDLVADLDARRAGDPRHPRRLFVAHAITALMPRWEEAGHGELWPQVLDLVATGSAFGIHVCATTETASVPHRLVAACEQRLVFGLSDPADHAAFGVAPRSVPPLVPGRALAPRIDGDPLVVQVATPADGPAAAVARLAHRSERHDASPRPRWIGTLPRRLPQAALDPVDPVGVDPDGTLVLPVGLADRGLAVATLELPPGGHALVAGPPRSGRTTALASLAHALHASDEAGAALLVVLGEAPPPTPWWPSSALVLDASDDELEQWVDGTDPLVVLVDDADRIADDHPHLARLVADRRPVRHVIAAGRADRLRSRYGHWTREVRADGAGLLLQPDLDLDGDLLGVRLPRRAPVADAPGRGWLAGTGVGASGFVQVALPGAGADARARWQPFALRTP